MKVHFKTQIDKLVEETRQYDWKEKKFYAQYVAQTFYYVRHSTRLLALASSKFSFAQEAMHLRFNQHIGEESQHEKLASQDLINLGYKLEKFSEGNATKSLYYCQYHEIETVSPVSLLGYILMLEGLAVSGGVWLEKLASDHFGAKCASFLRVHAREDIDHVDKAITSIESLPKVDQEKVRNNFNLSLFLYRQFLQNLNELTVFE